MNDTLENNAKRSTKEKRFQELDALRGIAAIMVVFFHFTMWEKGYHNFCKLGATGVDLFFMISGFVIFISIQKVSNSKEFIINRIIRLYPTYWTAVTFTFFILMILSINEDNFSLKKSLISYFGNLTMFQFYLRIPNIDGPYWTLIIEMLFYICIIILYEYKLLKYIIHIGTSLCISIVVITYYFYSVPIVEVLVHGFPLLQFIPTFFAGIIFYHIYITRKNLLFLYLLLIFCFGCQLLLFPIAVLPRNTVDFNDYTLMLACFFLIFTLLVNNKIKFIVNNITIFLGKISYALYLIHQAISIQVLIPYLTKGLKLNFWIASVFITLPIIIGIASLITFYIEIPVGKKLKKSLYLFIKRD